MHRCSTGQFSFVSQYLFSQYSCLRSRRLKLMKKKMRWTEIDGTANHLFAQKTNLTTRKKRVSDVRVFILFFFFCYFFSFLILSHSFISLQWRNCALENTTERKRNEQTKSFFQPCAGRSNSHPNRNSISAHWKRLHSHREESYQTKRIRSTNCRARANIKFDFLNWKINYSMNESAAPKKQRKKNKRKQRRKRGIDCGIKSRNRLAKP